MKKRKIVSLIMALALCLPMSAAPVTSFAAATIPIQLLTQPQSRTVAQNTADVVLSVSPVSTGLQPDKFSYQWQSSTTGNSNWADITVAKTSTYRPATTAVGTTYYHAVVSYNDGAGNSGTVTSNTAKTTIYSSTLYTLSLIDATISGGTYNGDISGGFAANESVRVVASAKAGQTFENWTVNPGIPGFPVQSATADFIMPANNVTLTANYKPAKYTVSVINGTGGGEKEAGELVEVVANAAAAGKVFDKWTSSVALAGFPSYDATTEFNMPASQVTLTAEYKDIIKEKYTLTVINGTGGGEKEAGELVEVVANAAAAGKVFDKWTSSVALAGFPSYGATTEFNMPASQVTLTAEYKDIIKEKYTLTVINGTGGGEKEAGELVEVVANAAAAGKEFDKWTSSVALAGFPSYGATTEFNMPASQVTLTAEYKDIIKEKYTLTVVKGTGGGEKEAGELVKVVANAAAAGKVFDKWTSSVALAGFPSYNATTEFNMPASQVTLTAEYKDIIKEKYTLTVVNGTGGGEKETGELVEVVAPAKEGHTFVNWTASPNNLPAYFPSTNAITKFNMPAYPLTLTANYKSTASTVTGMTITPSTVNLKQGDKQTFTHKVTGTGTPSQAVTWSLDAASVKAGHVINNSGVLTVAAKATIGSKITVTAQSVVNANVKITAVVTIVKNISTVTSVTISPRTITLDRPDTRKFTAAVSGTNSPSQDVTWSVSNHSTNNTKIDTSGNLTIGYNETSYYIYVKAVSKENTGVSDTATVKVDIDNNLIPPTFHTNLSSSKTVYYGNNITLTTSADVDGSGSISYQWYKNSSRMSGETSRTLTIKDAASSDRGDYYVIATNTYRGEKASTKSVVCTLRVTNVSSGGSSSSSSSSNSGSDDGGTYGGSKTLSTTLDLEGKNFSADNINTRKDSYTIELTGAKEGYVTIPVRTLNNLKNDNKNLVLSIQSSYGAYEVPVNIISKSEEAQDILDEYNLRENEADVKITIKDVSSNKNMKEALNNRFQSGKMLGSAVDFEVKLLKHSTGKEIGTLTSFSEPIQRHISLSKSSMPGYYGVFRFNESNNSFDFVPHKVVKVDGVNTLQIHANSNSTYVAVENEVNFSDVSYGMWYTDFIKIAASKGIVVGVGSNIYLPDKTVTRAEFVQMVVKVLALPEASAKTTAYTDINKNDWYYDSIMRAKSAGILDKFNTVSFSPETPINREEMAVVLAGAIRSENKNIAVTSNSLSSAFVDYHNISQGNISDVSYIYNTRIMLGVGGGYFDPKGISTRAQAATVLVNMLQKLDKI